MQTDRSAEQMCRLLGIDWHSHPDADSLASVLSKQVAQWLQHDINSTGKASLVVSGGSTPLRLFRALSGTELDWSRVEVTLADERWVPADHADSNERLVRTELMVEQAAAARFVPLFLDTASPAGALADVEQQLAAMPRPYSVVILGMGADGHTASLFPDAPEDELAKAMDPDGSAEVCIQRPPSVSQIRISLTRAALLRSKRRVLHISGTGKQAVLSQALSEALADDEQTSLSAAYVKGMKPVVGLLTSAPENASVYWSP